MLTKEEKLLFSLSAIKEVIEAFDIDIEVTITKNDDQHVINAYEVIEKFVVDYVNSLQPLKFEELKPEMWVWDNVDKEYRQIESKAKKDWVWFYINYRKEHVDEFYEENRFYRKQVEE